MPARILAAVIALALLSLSTPANATIVEQVDNLTFFGGFTLNGKFTFDPYFGDNNLLIGSEGLSLNGIPSWFLVGKPVGHLPLFFFDPNNPGSSGPILTDITIDTSGLPNLNRADFTLFVASTSQHTFAYDGTVACVSGCSVSPVPLPDALPMFGAALLGFMGFAAWRSRRV